MRTTCLMRCGSRANRLARAERRPARRLGRARAGVVQSRQKRDPLRFAAARQHPSIRHPKQSITAIHDQTTSGILHMNRHLRRLLAGGILLALVLLPDVSRADPYITLTL